MAAYGMMFLRTAFEWFGFTFAVYLIAAGGGYLLFWGRRSARWQHKRIQPNPRRQPQPLKEFLLSMVTLVLFAVVLGSLKLLTAAGWTLMYDDIALYGTGYFVLSVAIIALVHDSYYYWAHRAMHGKFLFRTVHNLHHQFTNPTPFASYAFHPFEGMIEIAVFGILLFIMPIHPWALGIYIAILTVLNVVSHLGVELYPAWIGRWFITSTHHNLHHSRATGHYMLYFNIWDRLMGTNQADYHQMMERLAGARAAAAPAAPPQPNALT